MDIPKEVSERFYRGDRTEQVRFAINDAVRVKSGTHAGRTASVISIITLQPETILLIEPGSPPYGDLHVAQSNLELIE